MPHDSSGHSSNNLFGIKAGSTWDGSSVLSATTEVDNGASLATRANFRSYDNTSQSFQDYVTLLRGNPRYAAALNTGDDVKAFATALQHGGYATDPNYARKVSSLADSLANALAQSPALKSAMAEPINGGTRLL